MNEIIIKELALFGITGLIGVIAYFLRQKDESQAKDLEEVNKKVAILFIKHDEDAAKLSELKERIAKEHYLKGELDNRFDKMERAFQHGFSDLGVKLDKLTSVMMDHISNTK